MSKKFKLPFTVSLVKDETEYLVPLSIIFLAIVVSATVVFLVIS